MRYFSPFMMKRCEFLSVLYSIPQKKTGPIITNLEHYGKKVIIPIKVVHVLDHSFTSKFLCGYPPLYMEYLRYTVLSYEFREDGALISQLTKNETKHYTTAHDIHVTSVIAAKDLRPDDVLLCSNTF
jgi:hypothetical protein